MLPEGSSTPQAAGPRAGSWLLSRWGRGRPAAMDSDGVQTEAYVKGISVLAGKCCARWKYQCTETGRAPRTASCACLHQYARRDRRVVRCFARGAIEEFIFAVVRAFQVNQATKLKSKAGRLQEMAAELLSQAKTEKEGAAALKAKYYKTMDDYGKAVQKIDDATMNAQKILDQMNAQSLTLAQVATQYGTASGHGANPGASAAVALKGQLQKAQQDLAAITSQKAKADEDTQTARQLADQYQPMIIDAEKDKRSSDFKFQEFARLTQEADSLQTRADALLSRADTIDGLIQVFVCACETCVGECSHDVFSGHGRRALSPAVAPARCAAWKWRLRLQMEHFHARNWPSKSFILLCVAGRMLVAFARCMLRTST